MRWLTMGAAALLLMIVYVPLLREVFGLERPHAVDVLAVLGAGIVALVCMEAVKYALHVWDVRFQAAEHHSG